MSALQMYPEKYQTYGSAVPIKSKVKITPPTVNELMGAMFSYDAFQSTAWEIDYKVKINGKKSIDQVSRGKDVDVLALIYSTIPARSLQALYNKLNFTGDFGYKSKLHGLGLFLIRDKDGKYILVAHQDSVGQVRLKTEALASMFRDG